MKGRVLGQSLALALPSGGQILSACLPGAVHPELLATLVRQANDDVPPDGVPYAVQVVPDSGQTTSGVVPAGRALKYRAGRRLLVWREGDFDPDWSFGSTVEMVVHPEFPARVHPGLSVSDIAVAAGVVLAQSHGDKLVGTDWSRLEGAIERVLRFFQDALRRAGNRDIAWNAAWWTCAAQFLDAIDAALQRTTGHLDPVVLAHAAAGLPVPDTGDEYTRLQPKVYADAVSERWSNLPLASETLGWLEAQLGASPALADLPWDDKYAQTTLVAGHPVVALCSLGGTGTARFDAWAGTRESEFLGVARHKPGELQVGLDGDPLPRPGATNAYIVPIERILTTPVAGKPECVLRLQDLEVFVPWMPDATAVDALTPTVSDISLNLAGKSGWDLDVDRVVADNEALVVTCTLRAVIRNNRKWPERPLTISVEIAEGSSLHGVIDRGAQARIVVPCPWMPCAIVCWGGGKRKIAVSGGGAVRVSGSAIEAAGEPEVCTLQLQKEEEAHVVVYDARPGAGGGSQLERVLVGGVEIEEDLVAPWPIFDAGDARLVDGLQVVAEEGVVGHELIEVSVEVKSPHPWLPLAATAQNFVPESAPPRADMEASLRGQIEDLLASAVDHLVATTAEGDVPDGGLWQCVMPVGGAYQFRTEPFHAGTSVKWFATVPESAKRLDHLGTGPSEALIESSAARAFWSALRKLADGVASRGVLQRSWPSRWQLGGGSSPLEKEIVELYLEAYTALVKDASQRGAADHFWASYPFSVVFYDFDAQRVDGVALSPLHPVRLAWLYGAERAVMLATSENRAELIQLAEGWNHPWVGPAPAPYGNPALLAAIPIDPGPEQLFLGWSMLVRFDNAQGSSLTVPSNAAGMQVPGGSASGLNEGGVGAAMRDFLRIYPHLTTLSVDLFSSTKSSRSTELDRAVVAEFAASIADRGMAERLPGGLRVLDSLNREGAPPSRDEAIELLMEVQAGDRPPPFVWERYDPACEAQPPSDLRLVEDAQAQVARVSGGLHGAATRWPIRRFGVHSFPGRVDGDVHVSGCIAPDSPGWSPYIRALATLECPDLRDIPALQVRPSSTLRASHAAARWVVSGSLHVNPGAVARAVSDQSVRGASDTHRMLWEWRPAHLPGRRMGLPRFERRPYMTIATIPHAFEESLAKRLGAGSDLPAAVFSALGRRGVGLASLLAIGGNHALGALGFFFGFKLLDCGQSESDGVFRVTVPLDAVDPLLRAVAGKESEEYSKRADLLVIEVRTGSRTSVTMLPVEIKCHGFDVSSSPRPFPSHRASEVQSALEQLDHSLCVLSALVVAVERALIHGDASLECAALGAVLESAILLDGRHLPEAVASKALCDVASGTARIAVGRGVVLWLQDTPDGTTGVSTSWHVVGNRGVLFVDPALGNTTTWPDTPAPACDAAKAAVEWCFSEYVAQIDARALEQVQPSGDGSGVEVRPSDTEASAGGGAPTHEPNHSIKDGASREQMNPSEEPESEAGSVAGAEPAHMPLELGSPHDSALSDGVYAGGGEPDSEGSTRGREHQDDRDPDTGRAERPTRGALEPVGRPQVFLGHSPRRQAITWDPYHPARRLNNAHVVILGASGAGKTQVTRAFLHDLCAQGLSSLVFDFKDDYVDPEFLASIGGQMLEADEGLPVNPLALVPDPITGKVKVRNKIYEVAGILRKVYRLGDQQEARLRIAIGRTYESAGIPLRGQPPSGLRAPTFQEVAPFLEDEGDAALVNRLSPIFDLELFTGEGDSLAEFLRSPTVIRLAMLPTEEVKKATAEVVLMSLYNTLLRLGHCHGVRLSVVIDEAHKVASLKAMKLLLKEARAYGAAVILSSQEARDFEDTVFSNAGSLLVLKLSETRDSERVAGLLGGSGDARELGERIRDLAQFHGFFRNDHYRPYGEVIVVPHYRRIED